MTFRSCILEWSRRLSRKKRKSRTVEDLEPITNPFYEELPSLGFTDSEGVDEEAEDFGLCKGCGTRLELTCTRPSRSHVRILLCLNCILEKIVTYGYNGNCGVKEKLTTRKL